MKGTVLITTVQIAQETHMSKGVLTRLLSNIGKSIRIIWKVGEVGMKFIVDEMPKDKSECPFSEWKPYPPIMEKTGHYICKINHNDCNLCETECQLLKREGQ